MKRFDIAIVGCGGISTMHLEGYAAHPERIRLAATCDIILERAQQAAETYGVEAAFASVEEAIDGADWEVAVVCTPTPVREEIVGPLAAAGKHIFIEKPMADTIGEAQRMVELCDAAGVTMAVDQTYRYYWPFDVARKMVADGRIGRVRNIVQRSMFFRQDGGWRPHCQRHAIAVMGVHWVDGFRWVLQSEAKSVSALMSSSDAIECVGETDANIQIEFENGAAVSFIQSFSCPHGPSDTIIVGEAGTLILTSGDIQLFTPGADEPTEVQPNPYAGAGHRETTFMLLNELLAAIDDDTLPPNGCHDNLKTISLLDATYRSAEAGGSPIELQDGLLDG
ncbi:MAG: Gfo/Idh/MocA family protein [Planctomycetota bacterium]|jgi:predicted dehydrogenase